MQAQAHAPEGEVHGPHPRRDVVRGWCGTRRLPGTHPSLSGAQRHGGVQGADCAAYDDAQWVHRQRAVVLVVVGRT